jgi:hypothetical protein
MKFYIWITDILFVYLYTSYSKHITVGIVVVAVLIMCASVTGAICQLITNVFVNSITYEFHQSQARGCNSNAICGSSVCVCVCVCVQWLVRL